MNEGRVLFLLGEKRDDYHLVKKVVDVVKKLYGKKSSLEYLLSLDSFSETEKKRLNNIFHQGITEIYAWEFSFYYKDGIWSYKKSIYDHQTAVKKLLNLLNKKEFFVGSIVHTNDLSLIETLLGEWNKMYATDWRRLRVDEAPQFEINQEVLHFISNNLKERVGEVSTFDFGFVKAFMEAFHDYNVENLAKILTGDDSIDSNKYYAQGEKIMHDPDEIRQIFKSEYGFLADRFHIVELSFDEARTSKEREINLPGVYVHWSPTLGVVKVGKSHTNSRRRSMEHIYDNTPSKDKTYGMAQLADEAGAKVLLFNVADKENIHWLLSLEYFMEIKMNPRIPSDRKG